MLEASRDELGSSRSSRPRARVATLVGAEVARLRCSPVAGEWPGSWAGTPRLYPLPARRASSSSRPGTSPA